MIKIDHLVSCIIPTYNKFEYIEDVIKSVLIQDYPALELIIADDCSVRFPPKKIKDYIDINKRNNLVSYKIIQRAENLGTVKNLNDAIIKAHGEIIVLVAGDDKLCEYNIISRIIERMNDKNWDHVVCRRKAVNDNGMVRFIPSDKEMIKIEHLDTSEKQKITLITSQFYNMASGSAFSFRKDFFVKMNMYDTKYDLWEDGPFFYKMFQDNIKLNTAYDIVSIEYSQEGISSNIYKNERLLKDTIRFLENIINDDNNALKRKDMRIVRFRYERYKKYNNMNGFCKIIFILRYTDVIIKRRWKKWVQTYFENI